MIDRYSRPEMAAIWSEQNRYQAWLEVELLATEAWRELGEVPAADAAPCASTRRLMSTGFTKSKL